MSDPHRILGVPHDANLDDIRRAFWQLARQCRLEVGDPTGQVRLDQIRRAYHALSSGVRRSADLRARPHCAMGVLAQHRTASWYADEVAVDFPSVAALVDRVRASFFGEEAEHQAVSAEVRLTTRQAISGAPLRIQVPLPHTCPVCGGRGELWTDSCAICEGRGVAPVPHEIQVAVPARLRDGMRLRYIVEPSFAPATVLEIRFIIR